MARPAADKVKRAAVIGTGTIGSAWTALFLARGMTVTAWDPAPDAAAKLDAQLAKIWPKMVALGLAKGRRPQRLAFVATPEEALADAQFVQENATENEALKIKLLARLDKAARPDAVIASSTSGLLPSRIARGMKNPERFLVAHPFNPPYLIPLVEILGGRKTDQRVLAWAMTFYAAIGKRPLLLRKEVPGFLANRLQDAIWVECVNLVARGVCSPEDIDVAIAEGPGLRWAAMGPFLTWHLTGGEGGMTATLKQFGMALGKWTTLKPPKLTPRVRRLLISGTKAEAAGRSVRELEAYRDACVGAFMATKARATRKAR
ncbi:MAG: L-carnitine dehydrogenase [Alphaproteobacteria bacterium]|nr:L-carnitine dehydrogenase [Alphaproteobacteria bacterium]